MSVVNLREYQTRRLEAAADRMAAGLSALRVPAELQAVWNCRLEAAAKARVLKAEADRQGEGLPTLWHELLAVETGWRDDAG